MAGKDRWRSDPPNLTKLPKHVVDAINKPVPLKHGEIQGRLQLYVDKHLTGLNHPNARLYATKYVPDAALKRNDRPGIQLEIVEPKGKRAIAHFVIPTEQLKFVLYRMVQAHLDLGGNISILEDVYKELNAPKTNQELNRYLAGEEEIEEDGNDG